ncbi:hypothetical protein GGS23DRAFT_604773 [Durotheca rogersii]|uniref:uncharacterized protein n=1 Tax=Durotheca rogersii TaxID=419775 RepID=UPI00222120FB|nr:uncharacterized protein GGS23DRAFT_604773 [Durotheca rogersii]KAI5863770.1 hypothetical protein GGS23DRAFT_604773 [Durotheca rogersii]
MNGDARLPEGDHQFNNVVCSGSSTEDVQAYQFLDEDTSGEPNIQFGKTHLPLGAGPPQRTCDEQRQVTWDLLISPNLADNIDKTIKKAVEKGRKGAAGDKFKLYVTGFPQFFSDKTDECDEVTFARSANPNDDGKEHTRMTQALRKEFNDMSVQLNKAIEDAVSRNKDQSVTWIPIDDVMEGHRYCEPGVKEPDQNNDRLWLYHYPYNEPKDDAVDGPLQKAFDKVNADVDIKTEFKTYNDFENALFDAVEVDTSGIQDPLWRGVGNRVKVFHPQIPLHEKIRDLVLERYISDLGGNNVADPTPAPAEDKNACHGVSGDYWVMSRDIAVDNAEAFCQQAEKKVTYNSGSVNELELSVRKLDDDSKGPADAPDCLGRFQRVVIDGCDGDDYINNPHNYKFGATFTSADGWEYTMTPLSKQVNEVSCDVSYKFFFDVFEIRGKNLPDAKFGANGEGLKAELSGCGAITKWNFERTPDDAKFQWYASGRLPIGTKNCVGNALVTAGGSGEGNCHGAGKRMSVTRRRPIDNIEDQPRIDAWPGYSDAGRHVFKHPATD